MGSPEFALPTLKNLAERYSVVGVVTQPDRPAGRGRGLKSPPVKLLADHLGIETIQPERLRHPEAFSKLVEWAPNLIVVVAFGQILRPNVLELPRFGCINVHASLLPRWRGAAPIQSAILAGDGESGVTIMKMDAGVDTGPILAQRAIPVYKDDHAESLGNRLSVLGAELLLETLPLYLAGSLAPTAQDESSATYAPMLRKEEGLIEFSYPAAFLERKIRAYTPWPGATMMLNGEILKIRSARVAGSSSLSPGARGIIDGLPAVGTSDGCLVLQEVQPAGKKAMPAKEFLRGARNWSET